MYMYTGQACPAGWRLGIRIYFQLQVTTFEACVLNELWSIELTLSNISCNILEYCRHAASAAEIIGDVDPQLVRRYLFCVHLLVGR